MLLDSTMSSTTPSRPFPRFKQDSQVNYLECYVDDDSYYSSDRDEDSYNSGAEADFDKEDDYHHYQKQEQKEQQQLQEQEREQEQTIQQEKVQNQGETLDCKEDQESTAATGTDENNKSDDDNWDWEDMFNRLVAFKKKSGHCIVPTCFAQDKDLAKWIKIQRRQLKDFRDGSKVKKGYYLLKERALRLENIGFEWKPIDPRTVIWETRFKELLVFVANNGHAQVPIGWERNATLANWVSTQRQEYKNLRKGRYSKLNKDRVDLLESIDFVWEAQRGGLKRQRKQGSNNVPIPQSMLYSSGVTKTSVEHFKIVAKGLLDVLGASAKGLSAQAMKAELKKAQMETTSMAQGLPSAIGSLKCTNRGIHHRPSTSSASTSLVSEDDSTIKERKRVNDDDDSTTQPHQVRSGKIPANSDFVSVVNGSMPAKGGNGFNAFSNASATSKFATPTNTASVNMIQQQLSNAAAMGFAFPLLNPSLAAFQPFNPYLLRNGFDGTSTFPTSALWGNGYGLQQQQQQYHQHESKKMNQQELNAESALAPEDKGGVNTVELNEREKKRQKVKAYGSS